MEIKEVLEKALAFYDDHDWIQGQSFSHRAPEGPYGPTFLAGACLEGACRVAGKTGTSFLVFLPGPVMDALSLLGEAAYELFPERFPVGLSAAVHKFNDHELTTREDAILALKHAIGKLENGSHDRAEHPG